LARQRSYDGSREIGSQRDMPAARTAGAAISPRMRPVRMVLELDGAAIFRDVDGNWLGDAEHGPAALLEGDPGGARAMCGMGDGRWAHGGLMPAGAVRARVLLADGSLADAATAAGTWLFVGDEERHRLPVRFEDGGGRLVRPQLPADWPRERVADAGESCPLCGGDDWDLVIAMDGSRGRSGTSEATMRNGGVGLRLRGGQRRARRPPVAAAVAVDGEGCWLTVRTQREEDAWLPPREVARQALAGP
jgi:hypothetical protein